MEANRLVVIGLHSDVERFVRVMKGTSDFDLKKIWPIPDDVISIKSETFDKWLDDNWKCRGFINVIKSNVMSFGNTTTVVYQFDFIDEQYEPGDAPSTEWVRKIGKYFPDLTFEWEATRGLEVWRINEKGMMILFSAEV